MCGGSPVHPTMKGCTVDSSRKSEVTRGVVLPLVVLVVVVALGHRHGQHAVFIAMMAAVPMLAAVFAAWRSWLWSPS